jgi:chaperonin cofactor prefoldin
MNADISLKALGKFEDAITKRLDTIMQQIEKLEEKIDTLHEEVQQSHAVASAPLMPHLKQCFNSGNMIARTSIPL